VVKISPFLGILRVSAVQGFGFRGRCGILTCPMPDELTLQSQTPDALMLFGFWYRALPADQVGRGQLAKTMLLEQPLVLGRGQHGRAFALRDACPHRGMPLSCGRFDGDQIECSYHGWRFDAHSGQCKLIPSLVPEQNLKVDRIYAGSYPCEERDDFIWVFIPDPGPVGAGFSKAAPAPTPAPEIPKFSEHYKLAYLTADLPCSVDHGIIGLMDPAHGPFVHQAWWWRTQHSIHEKQKNFEPIPYGFRSLPLRATSAASMSLLRGIYFAGFLSAPSC
jgi:phenylpropionate dioxygenase-like ring-hydroxylating dioxygenase large terminal subunit